MEIEDQNIDQADIFDALPRDVVEAGLKNWFPNLGELEGTEEPPADEPAAEPPSAGEQEQEDEEDREAPPTPPGGPLWNDDEGEDETSTAASTPPTPAAEPPDPVNALLTRAATDPQFRANLRDLLGVKEEPTSTTPPTPQFTEEDWEQLGPIGRHLIQIAAAQQRELATLKSQQEQVSQQVSSRNIDEWRQGANSAAAAFQKELRLPDDLMGGIRSVAGDYAQPAMMALRREGVAEPSPYEITSRALQIAYWNDSSARRFEWERQTQARSAATTRKQKLAGVGGSSGSAPRNPPPPDLSDPDARHKAMVDHVRSFMNGDEE